jgi:alpha-methylacyl-CoA racemase
MSETAGQARQACGPLRGIRVVEFAGMGPAPYCGMLFSDLGADVLRVDRPGPNPYDRFSFETRGRRSVVLDLKTPAGVQTALHLIGAAEGLIEGYRPGVMEQLGLGPEVALARNPRLVYGRMTGWGQSGPYASMPGHDLNYVALSGALHALGSADRPAIPLNLIGDFGGGALFLAFGMLAALLHARQCGEGQVIDCAMTDGTISLMALLYGHLARGTWRDERESNIIDGAAHFYNVYQCADGEWIAVAAIEPQFYRELLRRTAIEDPDFDGQLDAARWPALKGKLAALMRTRTRAQWCEALEGSEACFAPVVSMREAHTHPHNVARQSFTQVDGLEQPAVAPRFSRTPGRVQGGAVAAGAQQKSALRDWGVPEDLLAAVARLGPTNGSTG